jgi:four helix bundle protein
MDVFEDLKVWKQSVKLAADIYNTLKPCKDYALKDQVTRAAVSISSNIAEGYERNSNRQFAHYLQIAKGSCGELRSQLYICEETGIISTAKVRTYQKDAKEISRMLQGLITYCRRKDSN